MPQPYDPNVSIAVRREEAVRFARKVLSRACASEISEATCEVTCVEDPKLFSFYSNFSYRLGCPNFSQLPARFWVVKFLRDGDEVARVSVSTQELALVEVKLNVSACRGTERVLSSLLRERWLTGVIKCSGNVIPVNLVIAGGRDALAVRIKPSLPPGSSWPYSYDVRLALVLAPSRALLLVLLLISPLLAVALATRYRGKLSAFFRTMLLTLSLTAAIVVLEAPYTGFRAVALAVDKARVAILVSFAAVAGMSIAVEKGLKLRSALLGLDGDLSGALSGLALAPLLVLVSRAVFFAAFSFTGVVSLGTGLYLRAVNSLDVAGYLALAAASAAIAEEIIFRHYLYPLVSVSTRSSAVGLAASTILWAVLHGDYPLVPGYVKVLQCLVVGVVLCLAYDAWGLEASILAHLGMNLLSAYLFLSVVEPQAAPMLALYGSAITLILLAATARARW